MIDITQKTVERAMLVALNTKDINKELVDEHLAELEELALTAGAETISKIVQQRPGFDSAYYIGKGKAEEMKQLIEMNDINLVIFDDDLSPVQVRNLEKLFERKIVDRSGLILDIFASRAKTKEAKTQVELAQLQYMLPRLTRAWTHLSKQYGGIGTKGPGETQIETDRRMIRNRISHLKDKLEKIESHRVTQSQSRKDFIKISLVGYTNAGKSTLFNLLTKADVFAEDKLFATLDSTTRSFDPGTNEKILLSDTVGFIRKLPAHLVASFKSTLNEVRDADIILHVVDFSHPYYLDHVQVVEDTLKGMDCDKKTQIKIFNKIDLVQDKTKIDFVRNKYENCVIVSAQRGINISGLNTLLTTQIEQAFVEEKVELNITNSKTAAAIHSMAEVIDKKYDENLIYITYRTNKANSEKIKKMIANV
ncbi:MAG TPA: GTPase HflX [Ignavibacteriaceae bacterium]|nr:GTPase HflX [Ignavibacteriaceae bacterium]